MLTVVIPVYNVEAYVKKCIQSVCEQSYRDMEIILINDGSTDRSGDICRTFAAMDPRIRYIEKENGGSGETRNLGIRMAGGEYITFLDADDWWHRDFAEKMMGYADIADIVICDLYYIDDTEEGRKAHISKIRMPDRIVLETDKDPDLINKGRTFLCGKIFRRDLFIKNGIWQPTMAINDIPIVPVLIALSKKICRVGEPLYYYLRTREGNTISSISALQSFGDALVEMKKNFDRSAITEQYMTALKKMYYSQIRFAYRKARKAYVSGRMTKQDHDEVKGYLFHVIESFWPDWPDPSGKRFLRPSDPDIEQAIKNILFDDEMLVTEGAFDHRVSEKGKTLEQENDRDKNAGHTIEIKKDTRLVGEDLWWQMADDLLFRL